MRLGGMLPFRTALCGLVLMAVSATAGGLDGFVTAYCSSENTGSSNGATDSIYMSMGRCSTQCRSSYAFAIVQGESCWCSNYIPFQQGSTSSCSSSCPGYPPDQCGNPSTGMFGYIALDIAPSGTAGAPSSTKTTKSPTPPPATTSDPPPSAVSQTTTKTVTREETPSPSVVVSFVTPTQAPSSAPPSQSYIPPPPSSSSSSSSSSSESTSTTGSSHTTQQITTISSSATTHRVTSTPVGMSPSNESNTPSLEKKGLSGGAIAGIVIGTLIGLAAVLLAAFLLWRRRRNPDAEGGRGVTSPKRKGSVLSRTGLLGAARPQSMAENHSEDPFAGEPTTRSNSVRHSMMFGAGAAAGEAVNASGPLGSSHDDNSSSRRHSKPLVYDQRLNPSALFANHDNSSRVSMQDQQDYSRPLGLANSDFRYSFDSR